MGGRCERSTKQPPFGAQRHSVRRRGARAFRLRSRLGAGLADPQYHRGGAAGRRLGQRHHGAGRDGAGRQAARADRRDREPAGRRRDDRRQPGREVGAGRLHGPRLRRARDRARALCQAALRYGQRLHPGHPVRAAAARGDHRAHQVQDPGRPDRRRQGQGRRDRLFDRGRRIGFAFRRRAPARQRRNSRRSTFPSRAPPKR